jgi:hypothetical protein
MNESVYIKNKIINTKELQQIISVLKVFLRLIWEPPAGGCARHA